MEHTTQRCRNVTEGRTARYDPTDEGPSQQTRLTRLRSSANRCYLRQIGTSAAALNPGGSDECSALEAGMSRRIGAAGHDT